MKFVLQYWHQAIALTTLIYTAWIAGMRVTNKHKSVLPFVVYNAEKSGNIDSAIIVQINYLRNFLITIILVVWVGLGVLVWVAPPGKWHQVTGGLAYWEWTLIIATVASTILMGYYLRDRKKLINDPNLRAKIMEPEKPKIPSLWGLRWLVFQAFFGIFSVVYTLLSGFIRIYSQM